MRQVPSYLLIGNGRVSRHFQYYFSQLNLPFAVWFRELPLHDLTDKLNIATRILILISDDAIDSFIEEHLTKSQAIKIHFSGSLVTHQAFGVHPLMTFNIDLYSKERYQSIPFIIDQDAPPFENLFPGLTNPHFRLDKNLKAKYHALCVLSGNYSCMLWQKLFTTFENEFGIPAQAAHPYLHQQVHNILDNYQMALTGPLVRKDEKTIQKNLQALDDDPFKQIYQSFIACYQTPKGEYQQ